MKKLSIIIPVYNTEKDLLEKCINSCPNNDDIEIIVVDDGSILDYSDLLNENIKYIKTTNGGVSKARNIGINNSNGEYITLLDSDDYINLDEKVLDNLNNYNIILTRNYILKENKIPNNYKFNKSMEVSNKLLKRDMFILEDRSIECVEPVWAKFYNREYLTNNNLLFNERLRKGEDVLFNYEAYSKTNNIYYLNEFTYNYLTTNESATRGFDKNLDINTFKLLEEFELLFKRLNIKDNNYTNYVFRLIVRLVRKYYSNLSEEEYNNKIDLLFSNVILNNYLEEIDISNYDIYKQKLYELVILKDKINLYDYIQEVTSKKLLKK